MPTVVVSSAIANKPHNGGNAWAVLNWVLGFRKLGADAYFVEQIDAGSCRDAEGRPAPVEESVNLAFLRRTLAGFGLERRAALITPDARESSFGLGMSELEDLARSADLLINITGHLTHPRLLPRFRRRLYLDLDPGYTQLWHAQGESGARLDGHDLYYTIGTNIGDPACTIPTGGLPWRTTRPPIVLGEAPAAAAGPLGRFTTVASWRGAYGRVAHGDTLYGLKAHEFRKFADLPRHAPQTFEIALDIHPGDQRDIDLLKDRGWHLVDPKAEVAGADDFHRYLRGSDAEFSAAQGVYVETRSGWISDRTVHYLALGKPALVQDTGLGLRFPVGEGLVPFRTLPEAIAGAERIARDYHAHRRAARRLAEDYFDSDLVLQELSHQVGIDI